MLRQTRFAACFSFALALSSQAVPQLKVDVQAGRHAINPWIYGINTWTDSRLQRTMRIPLARWGGDDATSYNWQTSVKNNTGDNPWVYQNYSVSPGFDGFHEANLRSGTVSLGTISLMDWAPGTPRACSFSVAKYGKQKAVAPDNADCGNGILLNGQQIVNDPNDAYVPVTPEFSRQWVRHTMSAYGPATAGGVRLWSLDNEPEWWVSNHVDIYTQAASYDDMLARNLTWAAAVKQVDKAALITGPVPGGWSGMLFSRVDMNSGWGTSPYKYWDNPRDQKAHGGVAWIPYYLQQMKAAEATGGRRLLDVLDVHAYIAPAGLSGSPGDAAMEKLRLTSTRAFWDPNYTVPGGGYNDAGGKEVAPQLVPRMRQWVADNYPGTMTGITEYNWGALQSITGALAQADILGIFGREALDVGTLWPVLAPTDAGAFAYKIFLNYDGAGGQFGETAVAANTDDPDVLSVFAAQRSDSALTVLVLNKTPGELTTTLSLAGAVPDKAAQVWQYSGANLKSIVRQADAAVTGSSLTTTFPAWSMTLFVVPQAQSAMAAGQPLITGIRSAASYDAAGVAPGEIVAVFGQGLGPVGVQGLQLDADGLVLSKLAGTRVLFNGVPAPLLYTSDKQLGVVVPYAAAPLGGGNASVVVQYQGNASAAFVLPMLASHAALFTNDSSGAGQGAILNARDGSRNGEQNPVARGEYVSIYGTGEGLTNVPGVDGRVSFGSNTTGPLPAPVLACSVTIGGQAAVVQYCGAAPGAVAGLLQVNALVPATVSAGNAVAVVVKVGSTSSQSTVTLAIR